MHTLHAVVCREMHSTCHTYDNICMQGRVASPLYSSSDFFCLLGIALGGGICGSVGDYLNPVIFDVSSSNYFFFIIFWSICEPGAEGRARAVVERVLLCLGKGPYQRVPWHSPATLDIYCEDGYPPLPTACLIDPRFSFISSAFLFAHLR